MNTSALEEQLRDLYQEIGQEDCAMRELNLKFEYMAIRDKLALLDPDNFLVRVHKGFNLALISKIIDVNTAMLNRNK